MNSYVSVATFESKTLRITKDEPYIVFHTTRISSDGFLSISHHCGQSASGSHVLMEEAHRQHLLNCKEARR